MKQLSTLHVLAGFALLGLLGQASPSIAAPQAAGRPDKAALTDGNPNLAKVSSHLLVARQLARQDKTVADIQQEDPILQSEAGRFKVDVWLKRLTPAILAEVKSAGLDVAGSSLKYARASGFIAAKDLDALSAIPEVAVVAPFPATRFHAGSVDDQADLSIGAAAARSTYGVDGTGLKIGILSDSFDDTIGGSLSGSHCSRTLTGSTPQNSGDLPASVVVYDNGPGGGTDEGAEMAEMIHDLAPGAQLLFYSAATDEATFAQGITDLVGCGANILVDDAMYDDEPMFQDGIVAQAAQAAVDAGVPYFAAISNDATFGVDQDYVDVNSSSSTFGNDFHDFGGNNAYATVTIPAGCSLHVVLQWNQPYSGVLGAGSADDFDLYSCSTETPGDCSPIGFTSQGCSLLGGGPGGNPIEVGSIINNSGSPATRYLAVDRYCGDTSNVHFRMEISSPNCALANNFTFESGIFDQAQVYGHAAAAGVTAVGAINYLEIDNNGTTTPPTTAGVLNVEPYSSLGGDLPFYFDDVGDPLSGAPVTRFKPELVGPDNTSTTFGTHFQGASASASHVAAVGALVLQASPDLDPASLKQLFEATARDIESPGQDDLSGFGLVEALTSVGTVSPTGTDCVSNLTLYDRTFSGTQFYKACNSITVGPNVTVTGSGDLTLRAGDHIGLGPGFNVQGTFTAQVDPALATP